MDHEQDASKATPPPATERPETGAMNDATNQGTVSSAEAPVSQRGAQVMESLQHARIVRSLGRQLVESQPLFGRTMQWKVADAKRGIIAEGETTIAAMRDLPPWPTGACAEALGGVPPVPGLNSR